VPSPANSTGNCCHTQELINRVSEKKLADEEFRTVTATLAISASIENKDQSRLYRSFLAKEFSGKSSLPPSALC
jgi:hypothetical protein